MTGLFIPGMLATVHLTARRVPARWLFRWAKLSVFLEVPFSRHNRKIMAFMIQALKDGEKPCSRKTARNHLVYRRWRNGLVYGWPGWKERWKDLVKLEGQEHLEEALAQQRGAILLSGHRFGYEVLVAPVLSLGGYKLNRTGRGANSAYRIARWGEGAELAWRYINYGDDAWSRLRALKKMQRALSKNELVHASVRTHRSGPIGFQIELFGQRYRLDSHIFELVEILRAPVLPCFCLPNDKGEVWIKIYPPLRPRMQEVMGHFGALYTRHLRDRPEVSRIWRRLSQGWDAW